jgi:hypothetical protein
LKIKKCEKARISQLFTTEFSPRIHTRNTNLLTVLILFVSSINSLE